MANWSAFKKIMAGFGLAAILLLLALGLVMRTSPGHSLVERLVARMTGGEIVVLGLEGGLPNHLRAERVQLRDAGGVWLEARAVTMDWSALAALFKHIKVSRLSAGQVSILRKPIPAEPAGTTPRLDIARFDLPEIVLAPAVAGEAARFVATGALHYRTRHDMDAKIVVTRAQQPDRYIIDGSIADDVANGTVLITEGANGLLGDLLDLPGLRPINLRAAASGTRDNNLLTLALTAEKLRANGRGRISLGRRNADIAFSASAPAMALSPAIGWSRLATVGRLTGSFDRPDVKAGIHLEGFTADGLRANLVQMDVQGQDGHLTGNAHLAGLHVPGAAPDILANSPVMVTATVALSDPNRPISFALKHPLLQVQGTGTTRDKLGLQAHLTVPSLAPFAALLGGPVAGAANLTLGATQAATLTTINVKGRVNAEGKTLLPRLVGRSDLAGSLVWNGQDIQQSRLSLEGQAVALRLDGTWRNNRLDYRTSVELTDLAKLTDLLVGHIRLSGRVTGPLNRALLQLDGGGDLASKGFTQQHVNMSVHAEGLPQPSSAALKVRGRFDDAALALDAAFASLGDHPSANLKADWKSVHVQADILSPFGPHPAGHALLDVQALTDLAPFVPGPIKGGLHLAMDLKGAGEDDRLTVQGRASELAMAGANFDAVSVAGAIANPFSAPVMDLALTTGDFSAYGWSGKATVSLDGPLGGARLALKAQLHDPLDLPASIDSGALLAWTERTLRLEKLQAVWRGEGLSLMRPASIRFSDGVSLDDVRIAVGGGSLTLSGRLAPQLAFAAALRDVRADLVSLFVPQLSVSGTVSATADLRGSLQAPLGRIEIHGRNLRNRVYAVTAAITTSLDGTAVLQGSSAAINASLTGEKSRLTLAGKAPLAEGGMLDLRLQGRADLALLDPLLGAGGQRMRGTVQLDTNISGQITQPRIRGSATLADGEFQDFARGIRLQAVTAALRAQNDGVHIVELKAAAGAGTITGSGTVDAWTPGMPIDLTLHAGNARPIVSDLLTATISGSAKLAGQLSRSVMLSGALTVPRAEVMLPRSFPPEVRSLNVRRRGEPPPPPAARDTVLSFGVTVTATGPVTLRGRGIDADLGGSLNINGTASAPRISGGFQMRRGTFSIAGQTLSFSTGKVSFDGTGVRGRMDPALDFVASQTSGGVTATLTVGGYASRPKITLSSSPQLPQDEVLARLLFQQSAKQISPFQLAEGAQALAEIAGVDSGFTPLASLRSGLGLDRLAVGGGGPGEGSAVEAGKYVSNNIYVGARQNTAGGTQAQVQIDLTENLKAQATVRAGTSAKITQGASATQDRGNSIGLSYQFEY